MRVGGLVLVAVGVALVLSAMLSPGRESAETPPPIDAARVFAAKGCVGCHHGPGVRSESPVGPDLRQLDRTPAEVRRSILDPQAEIRTGFPDVMPTIALRETEIDALVEWLTAGA